MALPTSTPSAPHPATCNRSYDRVPCACMAGSMSFYIQAFNVEIGKETCFTCSGVDMPKPTATGLVVACHIINPRLLVKGPFIMLIVDSFYGHSWKKQFRHASYYTREGYKLTKALNRLFF
ncbi:hypothetical protein CIPAW_16G095400 [Carya illinoinensis]|uniref:Uncharacterized protein n=1 Tax=Carya illinoinensis TaxID=32201 RepID=A0A8T1N8Q5_CARIL|nr:hypothetical protein CIPAW_16G095400 [Carya illinoinensis]